MQIKNRSLILIAVFLIALGILLMAATLIPGFGALFSWNIVFYILAAIFFLPALVWFRLRRELAALFIPGSILLTLGVIFTYNLASGDWVSWAYSWLLIPAGVGLGLLLAAWVGSWGRGAVLAGSWLVLVNVALFSLFSTLFGGESIKLFGAVLLILCGLGMLVLILFRRRS